MIEQYLSVAELAERLSISTDMVYGLAAAGKLHGIRLGGRHGAGILRFPESEVARFLASQKKTSA